MCIVSTTVKWELQLKMPMHGVKFLWLNEILKYSNNADINVNLEYFDCVQTALFQMLK